MDKGGEHMSYMAVYLIIVGIIGLLSIPIIECCNPSWLVTLIGVLSTIAFGLGLYRLIVIGANRGEGMNKSGIRHDSYCSRFSSPFSSCLSDLKWKWFLWRTIRSWEHHNKSVYKKHCKKGFHQLNRMAQILWLPNKKEYKVEYLKCPYCNYLFFSTVEDKRLYLALTGTHRKKMLQAFDKIKKQRRRKNV
jgi:hypothetical protein